MSKESVVVMLAVMSSPFLAKAIEALVSRKKNGAEVHNLSISGEISIGQAWREYAANMEKKFADISLKFDELNDKFIVLRAEKDLLAEETKIKDSRIKALEIKVRDLETELERYKSLKTI